MKRTRFLLPGALLLAVSVPMWGAPTASFSYQSAIIDQLNDAESKLVQLAEVIPQEKFAWRPAAGVRSFPEVLRHVAADNYIIPNMVGAALPKGLDPATIEKGSGDKAKVIADLKASFNFARRAVKAMSDKDMATAMKIFGQDGTKGGLVMILATHAHEHLGQAIAYARSMGVTPPWSKKM